MTLTLTHDYTYPFRGLWDEGGLCRVRIFQAADRTPVIVCTELPENQNTSITNAVEYLAAELIVRHFPVRFEHPEPVVWIEHYPAPTPETSGLRRVKGRPDFDRVTFASWAPRRVSERGVERVKLGEPSWSPLSVKALAALIGDELAALIRSAPCT